MPTAAVVLSGCGFLDGSEIHESVGCLVHLARRGIEARCFSPDAAQSDVVNHATGKPIGQARNCLVESARIARGRIVPLSELHLGAFDGVVFPGGYGAAKNLCTFASDGPTCTVAPEVERVVRAFHSAKKPLAMCCIAPVIAARVLGTSGGCTVTIGVDPATAAAIEKMGARHHPTSVTEAFSDDANRLVSTGAYMFDASPWEVFQGVGAMIDRFADWLAPR